MGVWALSYGLNKGHEKFVFHVVSYNEVVGINPAQVESALSAAIWLVDRLGFETDTDDD